jgi:hypothetical protein
MKMNCPMLGKKAWVALKNPSICYSVRNVGEAKCCWIRRSTVDAQPPTLNMRYCTKGYHMPLHYMQHACFLRIPPKSMSLNPRPKWHISRQHHNYCEANQPSPKYLLYHPPTASLFPLNHAPNTQTPSLTTFLANQAHLDLTLPSLRLSRQVRNLALGF